MTDILKLAAAAAALGLVAGCATGEDTGAGTADPAPAAATDGTADPARPGVVIYDGYAAALVEEGDTVATVAARTGVPAAELASYNGLRETSALRAGDELVLPPAYTDG